MPEPRCPDCDVLWFRHRSGAYVCAYCGQIRHDTPEIISRIFSTFKAPTGKVKVEKVPRPPKAPKQEESLF